MRRKVLILPSWYPSDDQPVRGIFIEDQAKIISTRYDVMVYVPPKMIWWREYVALRDWASLRLEQRNGVWVCRDVFPNFPRLPAACVPAFFEWARVANFRKLIRQWGKPDLIHAQVVLPAGWFAMKLGRAYGIPVVLTEHSGQSPFSTYLQSEEKTRMLHETFREADQLIAVSPSLAQYIQSLEPQTTVEVVSNVVRTDFFVPTLQCTASRPQHSPKKFLSVAILTQRKGLEYLLEAAKLLVIRGITNFELLIGGDGPDLGRLMKRTAASGLNEKTRFLGNLDREGVRTWMQNSDVFVLPSLSESFGLVLGEAMACGKPVISTHCGGPEFVVTPETGVLVPVADPRALADAMEGFVSNRLLFDPQVIRQSVEARFGVEAFLENISAVYEQLWT